MSEEIVAEILRKVQALPRSENSKFRVYKTRLMTAKKNPLDEKDAIVAAASKVGIDVGTLLTPRLESVSKTVSSDEGVITPIANSDDSVLDDSLQIAVNTTVSTPVTVLADHVKTDSFNADEYGKLINFPGHDDVVLEAQPLENSLQGTALTPVQHNAAIFSAASPAMTVSLKEPSIRWSIGVSSDNKNANTYSLGIEHRAMAQALVSSIAVVVCTVALIYYGAIAGGKTIEAWFWSSFCEVSGFALVIAPVVHIGRRILVRFIGVAMLVLGFITMHTSIEGDTQQKISHAVQGDSEVKLLEGRVDRLKADYALKIQSISTFDPEKFRSKREKLSSEAEEISKQVSAAETELIDARKALTKGSSANVASSWGMVEWLRRAALMLVNIISGHAMVGSLGILIAARARRK